MSGITLKNEKMSITVNRHGAELRSINKEGTEYLWNADPKFWNRSSPVLFPFVGAVRGKRYIYDGKEYSMGQHGFARDMDFELVEQSDDTVWFALDSSEESYEKYPFRFRLEIGYRLDKTSVTVMWRVKNTDEKEMYFSIGAHPAFFCPLYEETKQTDYAFRLQDGEGRAVTSFVNTIFGQDGLVTVNKEERMTEDGMIPITEHLFDGDALVIEDDQVKRVAILDAAGRECLAVEFDSPLVGIWSPPKKNAPFVCIEPWYGRCDSEIFDGELPEREWGNTLKPDEEFFAEYRIVVS